VDPLLERFELLAAAGAEHDQLAVQDVIPVREFELGEVAAERPAVARLQKCLLGVHEGERAKSVPLGLVGPALVLRQGGP
jgi:hypothetical protein